MEESAGGILTMSDPDAAIHLPPGQTPITSPKKLNRLMRQTATVGYVSTEMARLAQAMLVQYGPLSQVVSELMQRQMAFEDFCLGELDTEGLKARIAQISLIAQAKQGLRDQQAQEQAQEQVQASDAPSDEPMRAP